MGVSMLDKEVDKCVANTLRSPIVGRKAIRELMQVTDALELAIGHHIQSSFAAKLGAPLDKRVACLGDCTETDGVYPALETNSRNCKDNPITRNRF